MEDDIHYFCTHIWQMSQFYLQERICSFGLGSYSNNDDFWIDNCKIPGGGEKKQVKMKDLT